MIDRSLDDTEGTEKATGEAVVTIRKTGRMKVCDDGDTAAKAQQPQQQPQEPLRGRVDSNTAASVLSLNISTTNNSSSNTTDIHHNRTNTWELTPVSILIRTMGYMDNDTLMIMCLVCQQIKELIWSGQGMENKLIRIFELHPTMRTYNSNLNGIEVFLSNMDRYCRDGTKQRMLQGYHHCKIHNSSLLANFGFTKEYTERLLDPQHYYERRMAQQAYMERWVAPHVRMHGIVSLDLSSPGPILGNFCQLISILGLIMPNVRKLDLSNLHFDDADVLDEIVRNIIFSGDGMRIIKENRWNRLEILTWNNNKNFGADGRHLDYLNNLKEVYLDDCTFYFDNRIDKDDDDDDDDDDDNNNDNANDGDDDDDDDDDDVAVDKAMADMKNYPNIFLFYKLCKNNPLERVSILHARALSSGYEYGYGRDIIAQNVLIKFVRNSPSTLVWFRSDLTTANIRMLQSERPFIQFVNEERIGYYDDQYDNIWA